MPYGLNSKPAPMGSDLYIKDSSTMTSVVIKRLFYNILRQAEALKEKHDISSKKDHLKKFKKQIQVVASLIDTWWIWVNEYLQCSDLDENLKFWVKQYLLPLL